MRCSFLNLNNIYELKVDYFTFEISESDLNEKFSSRTSDSYLVFFVFLRNRYEMKNTAVVSSIPKYYLSVYLFFPPCRGNSRAERSILFVTSSLTAGQGKLAAGKSGHVTGSDDGHIAC